MSYPRWNDDPWDARNPSRERPIPRRQPSGYDWQNQPNRPPLQPRTNTQPRPTYSRAPTSAPRAYDMPNYPVNSSWAPRGQRPKFPNTGYDDYIDPPWHSSAPPPPRPQQAPRATSQSRSFAEPAQTRSEDVWTLARGQPTVTFEVVMQFPHNTRNLLNPMSLVLLQKRKGPKYCLGSAENESRVRRYVLGQMRRIIQLHREGGCDYQPGDKVRVHFMPLGDDICGRDDRSSCERRCARRLLAHDQLVARYERIVRLPHRPI